MLRVQRIMTESRNCRFLSKLDICDRDVASGCNVDLAREHIT